MTGQGERCPFCLTRLLHAGGLHCPLCGWVELGSDVAEVIASDGVTQLDSAEVAAFLKDAQARRADELRPDSRAGVVGRLTQQLATDMPGGALTAESPWTLCGHCDRGVVWGGPACTCAPGPNGEHHPYCGAEPCPNGCFEKLRGPAAAKEGA